MSEGSTNSIEPQLTTSGGGTPLLAFFAPLITFILVSNLFVIYAVSAYKPLKTPSNQLILSLAITDLLNAICVISVACHYSIVGIWHFGKIGCQIWLFMVTFLASSSNLHLCAISIDRYKAISSPLTYGTNRSNKKSFIISCFVWSLSFVSTSPPYLFTWGATFPEIFLKDTPCFCQLDKFCGIFLFLTMFFIPLLIIMVTYGKLYVLNRERYLARIIRAEELVESRKLAIKWCADRDMHAKKQDVLPILHETEEAVTGEEWLVKNEQPHTDAVNHPGLVNREVENGKQELEIFEKPIFDKDKSAHVGLDEGNLLLESIGKQITDEQKGGKVVEEESNTGQRAVRTDSTGTGIEATQVETRDGKKEKSAAGCQELNCKIHRLDFVSGNKRRRILAKLRRINSVNKRSPRRCLHCQARLPMTNNLKVCLICSAPNDLLTAASRSRLEILIQKERRSMFILAIIVCTFAVCWGPAFIIFLTMAVHPSASINIWLTFGAWLLAYLNSACNPIIYTIFNREFRDAFTNLFR